MGATAPAPPPHPDPRAEEEKATPLSPAPAAAPSRVETTSDPSTITRAPAPPPTVGEEIEMPSALRDEFTRIEAWAQANQTDARHDALRFWSLKIPAILVSACSGVLAFYKVNGIAVLAGAIGSFCVLLDGLNPGGALRNVHLRAFNELRILEDTMSACWNAGVLRGHDPRTLAADIIDMSAKEKERISGYITSAETSLGNAQTSPKPATAKIKTPRR